MKTTDLLMGAGIGAAAMFLLDPDRGARRRALVRDKATLISRKTRDGADATARDIANRARGLTAAARGSWSEGDTDDRTLLERSRARLGRVCSHPHAIDVEVRRGVVTLSGPILAHEVNSVMAEVGSTRGVSEVIDELDVYETGEGIPALQGEGRVAGASLDILQRNWAPATRALVGAGVVAASALATTYARRVWH
jgi:hypothetical protein